MNILDVGELMHVFNIFKMLPEYIFQDNINTNKLKIQRTINEIEFLLCFWQLMSGRDFQFYHEDLDQLK
jgi:hypothetical protein